ncbi:TRAP transporter small permease subunit [Marinomonas sp. GJ51-6]|uniref:TRAP transporter small permease subunit n=1 Tax=unclassified Marinomonas TaxID=196814 RepID=UPI0029342ABE|nr:TRAP transporter small permease subunit [Marinomonas sp. GJ51-6]WOD08468.1 TRAP transporter small permease subunit [Marinomonas sp. GJ51-6]
MLQKIEKIINKIMDMVGYVSSFLLIALTLIISYNVIGRYAFNRSSIALDELSWHIYSSLFLLGISYALRTESHVRVDIVFERLSSRTQAIINTLGSLVFLFPLCLITVYYGWQFMMESYLWGEHPDTVTGWFTQLFTTGIGEKSSDPGGLLNRFLIKGMIPLSFLFLILSSVAFLIKNVSTLLNRQNEAAN